MKNMDQKIDELKSYIEEQFCSRDKTLKEIYIYSHLDVFGHNFILVKRLGGFYKYVKVF